MEPNYVITQDDIRKACGDFDYGDIFLDKGLVVRVESPRVDFAKLQYEPQLHIFTKEEQEILS